MAQHFLLSAEARTISLKAIWRMTDDAAWERFKAIRWAATEGRAVCPRCECAATYEITTRRKWKCQACHHQFSVTSGTIFASRKLSFQDILAAIAIFANAVKGISALQLSRDLCVQYKTAFVMAHKLREALGAEVASAELDGDGAVEVDGMYTGGVVRPANRKADRVDRRLKRNQSPHRRVVVALRQRAGRTLPFVTRSEDEGVAIVRRHVRPGMELHADEATHWDALHATHNAFRINHSVEYSNGDSCTNQVESFFSRLRRAITGQHHHVSPRYLAQYANEAAWREDHRRQDNGTQVGAMLGLSLVHPVSRAWAGYWQR